LYLFHPFFFYTGAFSASFTKKYSFERRTFAYFMQLNTINIGRKQGKQTLNPNSIANFANCESSSSTLTLALNNISFKTLDTFLVTFLDFIVNSDIVTGFKFRNFFFFLSTAREQIQLHSCLFIFGVPM